ncbi:MAG TPA: hypothetical protein VH275_01580 [Solirubrobacterales bacterium]|nr:hypothetical protein [Solirubrobacterales bacterium]
MVLLLGGCGGGSETAAEDATQPQGAGEAGDRAYVAAADRICAGMVADSRRMAAHFSNLPNLGLRALTLTTRELVEPALPILERSAARLRALEGAAKSLPLESYVSLYDPIIAVVRERAKAGEAGDATRAHALELQMLDLSDLQRRLAREAGLKTCDVDFIHTFATSGHAR